MPKLIKSFGPYGIYFVEWRDKEDIEAIQRAKYHIYTRELSTRSRNIADTGIMLDSVNKKEDCVFDRSYGTVYIVATVEDNNSGRIVSAMRIVPWTKERHLPMENIQELGNGYPSGFDLMPYMEKHRIDPRKTYEFGRYFKHTPKQLSGKSRKGLSFDYIGFLIMRAAHDYVAESDVHNIFACAKPAYAKGKYMPIGMKPIVVKEQPEEELYSGLEMINIKQIPVRKGEPGRKITVGKYEYPMPSDAKETDVSKMKKYTFIPLHLDSKRAIERTARGEFYGENGETDLNEYFMFMLTPEFFPCHKKLFGKATRKYLELKGKVINWSKKLKYGSDSISEFIKF